MAGEISITVVGNVVAEPELRFTPAGAAVANFRIASTPRTFDKASNEWKDGESVFLTVNAWRKLAEDCAETIAKGQKVIVTGRVKQRSWDDKTTGQKRTVVEVDAEEIGVTLFALTKLTSGYSRPDSETTSQPARTPKPQQPAANAGGSFDEPPF